MTVLADRFTTPLRLVVTVQSARRLPDDSARCDRAVSLDEALEALPLRLGGLWESTTLLLRCWLLVRGVVITDVWEWALWLRLPAREDGDSGRISVGRSPDRCVFQLGRGFCTVGRCGAIAL